MSPDGIITTVAGVGGRGYGKFGYSGDGGPATEAELRCPQDAAIDPSGNLFIADKLNSVIRQVDPSGVISTFAGGGTVDLATASPRSGYPRKRRDSNPDRRFRLKSTRRAMSSSRTNKATASGRSILPATLPCSPARESSGFSGDGGPADKAQLNGPYGLAVDGENNVFIGDSETSRIRRVDPDGTITTVAGNGEVGTGGDGGPATEAQLESPYGLAVDGAGSLYIADQDNALIRIVDSAGIIRTR